MKIEIKGLKDMQRKIEQIERKVERVSGSREVPIDQLLTPDFMTRFTNFESVEDMLTKSGFDVNSTEDFEAIPEALWDQFIAANTQFPTWSDMCSIAGTEYLQKQLNQ